MPNKMTGYARTVIKLPGINWWVSHHQFSNQISSYPCWPLTLQLLHAIRPHLWLANGILLSCGPYRGQRWGVGGQTCQNTFKFLLLTQQRLWKEITVRAIRKNQQNILPTQSLLINNMQFSYASCRLYKMLTFVCVMLKLPFWIKLWEAILNTILCPDIIQTKMKRQVRTKLLDPIYIY